MTTLSPMRRSMADQLITSLILPTYNPGPAVERTWLAVRDFVRLRPDPWEAIFVLDGCTDGTAERLADLANSDPEPRLRVLSHTLNRGKGYAVRQGLLAARGAYRLFADVDLAYSFDDIARVASELHDGAAVAIASREHPESIVQVPAQYVGYAARRRLQSRLFGAVTRLVLPIEERDTQAGLKGMTAAVAETILPVLQCNGFGFDCELLTACARHGIPVTGVPVCVRYESHVSTTGMGSSLKMLWELWRIRRVWPRAGFPQVAPTPADKALSGAA